MGTAFLQQLAGVLPSYPRVHVCLIARSRQALTSSHAHHPLSLETWTQDLASTDNKPPPIPEIIAFLTRDPGPAVLVDNTSDPHLAGHYAQLLVQGISIVTPNKKAFSGPQHLWESITAAARGPAKGLVYHEASCGAGLPVLATLRDLVLTGDTVERIEGVFSGTMSFLFNRFMPGDGGGEGGTRPRWSAIVRQARERGYTEPDPRDDLNGMDVARKLVILARACGASVEGPTAFPVKSLIPAALESAGSADEFLSRLGEFDTDMDDLATAAAKEGKVLRYCGRLQRREGVGPELEVKMEGVPLGSPLAALTGADNVFCFYTKRYGDTPLVVRGAG